MSRHFYLASLLRSSSRSLIREVDLLFSSFSPASSAANRSISSCITRALAFKNLIWASASQETIQCHDSNGCMNASLTTLLPFHFLSTQHISASVQKENFMGIISAFSGAIEFWGNIFSSSLLLVYRESIGQRNISVFNFCNRMKILKNVKLDEHKSLMFYSNSLHDPQPSCQKCLSSCTNLNPSLMYPLHFFSICLSPFHLSPTSPPSLL